jgi:hypothetical protein
MVSDSLLDRYFYLCDLDRWHFVVTDAGENGSNSVLKTTLLGNHILLDPEYAHNRSQKSLLAPCRPLRL